MAHLEDRMNALELDAREHQVLLRMISQTVERMEKGQNDISKKMEPMLAAFQGGPMAGKVLAYVLTIVSTTAAIVVSIAAFLKK